MKTTYIDKITNAVAERTRIKNKYLVRVYALLVLVKGEDITLKDVHDAWAMDMNFKPQTDYCYGHEHLSIVPFDELSVETQNKDKKYVDILRSIAKEFK
ncbi:MAG: hypothetical protein IJK26_09765 [Clostridia bacterium]|nr:hypothetical protein [Clostridia bacterium]